MWCLTAPGVVVHRIRDDKSAVTFVDLVGEYTGTIVCDALATHGAGARASPGITLAACWAHSFRKFEEAKPDHPEAEKALAWIGALYEIDRHAEGDAVRLAELRVAEDRWELKASSLEPLGQHQPPRAIEPHRLGEPTSRRDRFGAAVAPRRARFIRQALSDRPSMPLARTHCWIVPPASFAAARLRRASRSSVIFGCCSTARLLETLEAARGPGRRHPGVTDGSQDCSCLKAVG